MSLIRLGFFGINSGGPKIKSRGVAGQYESGPGLIKSGPEWLRGQI